MWVNGDMIFIFVLNNRFKYVATLTKVYKGFLTFRTRRTSLNLSFLMFDSQKSIF